MFVVFLVCFVVANTLLNSISLIRRHVPESLLLTLYLILVHAQRNIGIKKKYNLEIKPPQAHLLLVSPVSCFIIPSLIVSPFDGSWIIAWRTPFNPAISGDARYIFGRFCVTSVEGMGCDGRLLSFLLIDDIRGFSVRTHPIKLLDLWGVNSY
jgi:hypothetical protein